MNELTLNPQNTAANIREKIKVLKDEITKINQKIAKETLQSVIDAYLQEIKKKNDEINPLVVELEEIENKVKNAAKDSLADLILKHDMAYIASDAKFVTIINYSKDQRRINLSESTVTYKELRGILHNLCGVPGKFNNFSEDDLRTVFEQVNRSYIIKTASFHDNKWDDKYVYNILSVQKRYWGPITEETDYSPYLDDLFYCLGGGKQENIEHLEKWVVYKRRYPHKSNTIPHLNITGKPGGNGKGLFVSYLASLFTPNSVYKGDIKELNGGFNSNWEGKIFVNLDDEEEKQFPHASLKKTTGSNEIRIEPKGINAYTVDATFSLGVTDNTGVVRMVGGGIGGEDRRWSILKTEIVLTEHLQKKYNLNQEEAKSLAEYIYTDLCCNRLEVSKHWNHIDKKYKGSEMTTLLPLHGMDYLARIEEQKDQYQEIFAEILPILIDQGIMPFDFIKQICEIRLDKKIPNSRTLSQKFDEFMSRNGVKNLENANYKTKISWKGGYTGDTFKGKVRRVNDNYTTFDYSLISDQPYNKNSPLSKDSIKLKEFNDGSENDSELL
jgi:hypothetical protein